MKCFNGECHAQKPNECLVFDDKKECRYFISESEQRASAPVDSQSAGSVDFTLIANRIRIFALGCKNKDAFSCEFGNEFAPKVESYLRELFEPNR